MKYQTMFKLSWVPGLFWLYPKYISHKDRDPFDNPCKLMFLHAVYTGLQVSSVFFTIIYFLFGALK